MMWRHPGFTIVSVMALALGIGLVSAQFSFIKGVMLTNLPFEGGEGVMHLRRLHVNRPDRRTPTPVRDYRAWMAQQKSFESLAAYTTRSVNLHAPDQSPQRYKGASLCASVLSVLRVQPNLGRGFIPADEQAGAELVVMLSHRVWQRDFGGREEVLGQTVKLDGEFATIIGILPREFRFPLYQEVWSNLRLRRLQEEMGINARVEVIGRLKDGIPLSVARNELNIIAGRLAEEWAENRDYSRTMITSFTRTYTDEDTVPIMLSMLAMVLGVLLIACTNVATMMLAHAVRRTREMAIRVALGANRVHLIARTLMESTLLSLTGGLGGLVLAQWGVSYLQSIMTDIRYPFWWNVALDGRVVVGTIGISLLAGILCGLWPARQASRVSCHDVLKDEGASSGGLRLGRFSRSLVHIQVILSGALLVVTVLMAKSVVNSQRIQLPFSTERMLMAHLDLSGSAFRSKGDRIGFSERLSGKLNALPGVESATITTRNPLGMGVWMPVDLEGKEVDNSRQIPVVMTEVIDENYFRTVGLPLLQGREFQANDSEGSEPVAIVNRSFVQVHWPNELPIGRRLRLLNYTNWITVIGVAPDLPMRGRSQQGNASGVYLPQSQHGWGTLEVLMRVRSKPGSWESSLRQTVWELAPDLPVHSVQTMESALSERGASRRLFSKVFTLFGVLAVFLAMLGVYGVMSFAVARRTREFGIRFALGAQPAEVRRLVLAQGIRYLVIGLPVAFLLAYGLSHPFEVVMTNVSRLDPVPYAIVAVALSLVVMLAAWLPARRAAKIDPMAALRCE